MDKLKKDIMALYNAIYDEVYAGELLRKPKLKISTYGPDYGYYWDGTIELVLWPHAFGKNDYLLEIADTLTHELVHALQDQENRLDPARFHDRYFKRTFKDKFNELTEAWA